jgi:ribosomal protein L16 Arg81 hydroxylase
MDLASTLGLPSLDQFLERHFRQFPFVSTVGSVDVVRPFGWDTVGQLLESPDVDWLLTREGVPISCERRPTATEAADLLATGHGLRFRHAERHCAAIGSLAMVFQRALAAPVDCHVNCTGANAVGLNWHYDAEDVFVLQTLGTKEWSLRKNTVHPWPLIETLPEDMQYERETMPIMRCQLAEGDWLYIPAGYWHFTRANEVSISMSVGLLPPTAIDLLDFLRSQLPADLRWRQRLPALADPQSESTPGGWQAIVHDLASDLSRRLTDRRLVESFLAARRPNDDDDDGDATSKRTRSTSGGTT